MEVGGAYSNTKDQVSTLEALRQKLSHLEEPLRVRPKRQRPNRAKHLDAEQVQQPIEGYRAGATVYDLAAEFGIGRNTVCRLLHRQDIAHRQNIAI